MRSGDGGAAGYFGNVVLERVWGEVKGVSRIVGAVRVVVKRIFSRLFSFKFNIRTCSYAYIEMKCSKSSSSGTIEDIKVHT